MENKDYTLPFQDLTNLVPSNLRNPMVKSLLDNLFNRFLTQDEASPLYGYVGRRPSAPDDRTPKVPQLDIERDINALIPVLSFKNGSETFTFTAQDLIRKAEVLGISENQAQWLYSQANNYSPPIDLDKFTNFFNYYWVAKALPTIPSLVWNPSADPEYYVISKPSVSDLDKLNVRASSTAALTLTGTGYLAQNWILTCTNVDASFIYFTLTTTDATAPLAEQTISFQIPQLTASSTAPWPTSIFPVSFTRIGAPAPLLTFNIARDIVLDGDGNPLGYESFAIGDTYTISAPFLSSTYNVSISVGTGVKGKITAVNSLKIYQTVDTVLLKEADRVLVRHGLSGVQGIYIVKPGAWEIAEDFDAITASVGAKTFVTSGTQAGSIFESVSAPGGFGWVLSSTGISNTNDWQEGNFWVKREDLTNLDVDFSKIIQAVRPIIDFSSNLQLNTRVSTDGLPTDSGGTLYQQRKSEFNQVPVYDLFRYDGTHAKRVSSLFFYVEDASADIDLVLQRRVKLADNDSADFLFAHGMLEENNSLLFYKDKQGALHTIWHPGYSTPTIVDQEFGSISPLGKGNLIATVGADAFSAQQIWTLTATSNTTFEVIGSKVRELPAPFNILTVNTPYSNGLFNCTISTGAVPFEVGDIFRFRIGNFETTRYVYRDQDDVTYDLFGGPDADVNSIGAWQTPRMFFNNVEADNGDEVPEGTLYSHFRGILANQLETTAENRAFGGSIKLWSEQQNLLASLLMQRDLTPISIIDLAQKQYETALNTIVDIFCTKGIGYFDINGFPNNSITRNALVDYILEIRSRDNDVRSVLYDSTAAVIGFPATLPLLGITPLVQPSVIFDNELGAELFRHHDGHLSPLFVQNGTFRDRLATGAAAYINNDIAGLLNQVLLIIEQRLYDGISSEQRSYFSSTEVSSALTGVLGNELKRELNMWAVQNGYDPAAPDYISTDAFTWNYSSSTVFAPTAGPVPARWFNTLLAHHATFGALVIPTTRPNLEPWKLLGNSTKPLTWDATHRAILTPDDVSIGGYVSSSVNAVSYSAVPLSTTLSGLPIIDGVLLTVGQTVLLTNEINPANNGAWVIAIGAWSRASTPLAANTLFNVQGGNEFLGTQFALLNTVITVNVDPVNITQVRLWLPSMWIAIQAARPTLKLSVDTNRDALLPPYVSNLLPWGVNALTNTLPLDPSEAYAYGESSPVETVWVKSIEFRYSLARAAFRYDALSFLGACWGFEWVSVDSILYDGYDMSVPGHKRFRLHGQQQSNIIRTAPLSITLATGAVNFILNIVRDAYTTTRAQSWSIKTQDGVLIGRINEGSTTTINNLGYALTNLRIEDQGVPFRLGDKFTLQANADGSGLLVSFLPFSYHVIHGLGQTFTHALRESSIDNTHGYAINAYRNWDINLGYRAGGLVSTDDLRVFTDQDVLPESAYTLRFKRSPFAKDLWAQALRITAVQIGAGTAVNVGDNSSVIPSGLADDWVFRIEGYNARHLDLEYYALDTSGNFSTFFALNKEHTIAAWKNFTNITNTVRTELPLTIVGLQNVINLVYGYAQKLQDDGWRFNDDGIQNIDQSTGRVRNWQLEIEKLIDAIYTGVRLGEGYILNPFFDRIWIEQDTGLLSKFYDTALFDVSADPGIFDVLGVKIETSDMIVLRQRNKSQISATVPMYSVHAQIDEFEHLFVFNNLISPSTNSGLIYDPFSGARISTIKLNGRRQSSRTLRPEFGGHYLVGDEVKKNLQASTDKIARYYDTDNVYADEQSTKHALALLGFTPKQYMSDLDLNDRTQFNFWRGLIQMKGTNASISAFLNNDRFEDAKLDEYWAYKVAEYGDSRSKLFPELKLTVNDTLQQFTKLIFDLPNPLNPPVGYETFTNIISDDEARWFTIDDLSSEPVAFEAEVVGTYTDNNLLEDQIITLPFVADVLVSDPTSTVVFDKLNARTLRVTTAGNISLVGYGPATPKFNPVKLFNYVNPELVEEIPHWHPAAGQHTGTALESVNIISNKDPARYNVSTLVQGNSNFDPLRTWGAREVGRVWWDITNLDYVPYFDEAIFNNVEERLSRWGTLADYASVDVVEWVQSSVPPNRYDAVASTSQGDADLDPRVRAEGTVYGAKTYLRERVWSIRPIAWSEAGVATSAAHPSFNGSYSSNITFLGTGELVALENGTFEQLGISAGMHLGAWQETASFTRPLNEFLVLDTFTKRIQRLGTDFSTFTATFSGFTGQISVSAVEHTDKVGVIRFQADPVSVVPLLDADGIPTGEFDIQTFLRIVEDISGEEEVIAIRNDRGTNSTLPYNATFITFVGQVFTFNIPSFGLRLTIKSAISGVVNSETIVGFIEAALGNDITLFDAVQVQRIVANPDLTVLPFPSELSNDVLDPVYTNNNGIGWRAWNVPTQADLNADSQVPDSKWLPYIGPYAAFTAAPVQTVIDGAGGASFTLNDGMVIERYKTDWADWVELKQVTLRNVQTLMGGQDMQLVVPQGTSIDRLSVYVNGVTRLTATYALIGTDLFVSKVELGQNVTVIIRPYSPSVAELAFDPTVADDLLIQRQYKTDYQYVQIPVRDSSGNISNTYFFWVKNRTSPAQKNNLSIKSVTQLLISGPAQFLTFQNIQKPADVWEYNAIAINGLNYVVTKNDTFKLRFTRNFTLRDDPKQLDLKDTHVEWSLIRPGQRTRIPESLWRKIVNTACAQDEAGNALPSPRRSSYDERNGTRTQFGFGSDQVLAPTELVLSTALFTILNTQLINESSPVPIPDYMLFLNFNESDTWFSTPENTRNTFSTIWNQAKVSQINELFFAILEDIIAANFELTDIFKTSRLSAFSIKVVRPGPVLPVYE